MTYLIKSLTIKKKKNQNGATKNQWGLPYMSEIRKHYFLFEYCIIAEERTKRPSDFAEEAENLAK